MDTGQQQLNGEIKRWAKGTILDLKKEYHRLVILHRYNSPSPGPSFDVLNQRVTSRQGAVNKISFRFPKHLIFVHKGVGKGVPAGFTGSTTRKAKEWFNPVIEKDVEVLADIVADNLADMSVGRILIG